MNNIQERQGKECFRCEILCIEIELKLVAYFGIRSLYRTLTCCCFSFNSA